MKTGNPIAVGVLAFVICCLTFPARAATSIARGPSLATNTITEHRIP